MFEQTYSYSDIGLVPTELSTVKSRDDVNTFIDFLDFSISLPIIAAPMNSVVGEEFCKTLSHLGGLACCPREFECEHTKTHIKSFSIKSEIKDVARERIVCVDVANSLNKNVCDFILAVKKENPKIKIITGNIASVDGYRYMHSIGVDAVRCGVGSGAFCSTSIKTGVGTGQASLIRAIANYRAENEHRYSVKMPLIIADGGIKTPGQIAIAIALGADIAMLGTMLGGCEETPGPVIKYKNKLYKQMAGQASFAIKQSNRYVEGDDTLIPFSGKLEKTWHQIKDGLRSAMSYMNCDTIDELKYLPPYNFCLLSHGAKLERIVHANI